MSTYDHGVYKAAHRVLVILILLGSTVGVAVFVVIYRKPVAAPATQDTKVTAKPSITITSVRGRYLFNGTIFWGRYFQDWVKKPDGSLDYAYPFKGLDTFNRAQYDAWTADLECPVTPKNISPSDQENLLTFNCLPEFLPEMAKYFNLIDLANNHSDNAGVEGLQLTRNNLAEQTGVQYFGHYDPSNKTDTCEVIGLPVRVQKSDKTDEKGSLPVAFCAWHYFYRMPLAGEIETMDDYAGVMPVFAFVHMGTEYKTKADSIQESVAHTLVDHGAEFVIANNPHWVQNSEVYNGKFIIYSTGNFIFDQQSNAEVTRSASPDISMTIQYNDNVGRWLELGKTCTQFHDDCLSKAKSLDLTKVQPKYTYSVVAGDSSNKYTKKGNDTLQKIIEERLNWKTVLPSLSQ